MPKTHRISHMWTEAKFKLGQWSTVFIFFNYPFKVIQKEIPRVSCIFGPCCFPSSSGTRFSNRFPHFGNRIFFFAQWLPHYAGGQTLIPETIKDASKAINIFCWLSVSIKRWKQSPTTSTTKRSLSYSFYYPVIVIDKIVTPRRFTDLTTQASK